MKVSDSRAISWSVGPVILLFAMAIAIAQQHPDSAMPAATSAGAVPVQTLPPAHDSLFRVISAGYQTLKPVFEHGCYDCHSSFTKYPWYHKLPIIKGLIDSDIKEARRQVDFSKGFPFTGKGSQADMLKGMLDEIQSGDMPPFTYRMVHWGRQITGAGKDSVTSWIDSSLARLAGVGITPSEDTGDEVDD